MKRTKRIQLLQLAAGCLCLLVFVTDSMAQGDFKFHVGPSFPTSDFGDDDTGDDDAGGAGIGINAGIDYLYPLSEAGLYIIGALDVSFNGLKSEYKEDIEDQVGNDVDVTFFNYINIPVSAGLHYQFNPGGNIDLFGNAGLAFNFLKVTNFKLESGNSEVDFSYGLTNSLGFKLSAGLILNQRTTIAVNVFNLGDHDLDIERDATGQEDQTIDGEQKVNFVSLTIGFALN